MKTIASSSAGAPHADGCRRINQHIAEVYREAVAAGHTDIEAIGISAAGNVCADRKTLTFSANIPAWINYDLSEHVAR